MLLELLKNIITIYTIRSEKRGFFSAGSTSLHFSHKSLIKGIYTVDTDTFLITALETSTLSYCCIW